jgi:hypothetical protein
MMEDILREPMELTEAELDEVAGGGGCERSCNPCGCDGGGPLLVIGVVAAVGIGIVL